MFRIKICGITHRPDARVATALGADAIGLNFYEGSPRYLSPSLAGNVAGAITGGVAKVGVFVNPTADEVVRLAERLQLDYIQLCGDEPPELLEALDGRAVLKSFRFGDGGIRELVDFLADTERRRCSPAAIVIDASQPGQFGGTGSTVNWQQVRGELDRSRALIPPIVLAGGLTPENVAEAIAVVRPAAVDVASGVEYAPGRKDALRVSQFIENAITAFAAVKS